MPETPDSNRHLAFLLWFEEHRDELRQNYKSMMNSGFDLPPFMVWANREWLED